MRQEQVEDFRVWFDDYVAGFYGDDEYVNANLKSKEEHSRRVCKEMLYLADELGLGDEQKRIAEATGLFHDIGRFRQFVEYRTYNDVRSVNHCLLGVEEIRESGMLREIEDSQRQLIEKAIEYHGLKKLPDGLDGECAMFCRMIRDADKLDVFYVVTRYYKQYRDNPEQFRLEMEFPDEDGYSSEMVDAILQERLVDYSMLRTLNDMKLLQLGWVYDVNFAATLRRMKQRRFLEKVMEFLPKTGDIEKVREKVFGYVDSRIERDERRK